MFTLTICAAGETLSVSEPAGCFSAAAVCSTKQLILIAAGSGSYAVVLHPCVCILENAICMIDAWAFKGTATGYISHVPQ